MTPVLVTPPTKVKSENPYYRKAIFIFEDKGREVYKDIHLIKHTLHKATFIHAGRVIKLDGVLEGHFSQS